MFLLPTLALALSLLAPTTPDGESDDWLALDREVERLAASLESAGNGGPTIGGLFKFDYRRSNDITVNGNDLGGFRLKNLRLVIEDQVGDVAIRVEPFANGNSLTVGFKDAYARLPVYDDSVHLQVGRFKPPLVASSTIYEPRNVFYRRGEQGFTWAARDQGVQVDGAHGPFHWYAAVHNGGDGAGDEVLVFGKGTYAVAGEDLVFDGQLGGFGPGNDFRLTLGAALADEGSISDGTVAAFELLSVYESLFFHAEVLDYDDGFAVGAIPTGSGARADGKAGTTPYDFTAQWMPNHDWGVQVRWEDQDDDDDTRTIWGGVTRYLEGGAARVDLHYASTDSDAGDIDILLAGLTLVL